MVSYFISFSHGICRDDGRPPPNLLSKTCLTPLSQMLADLLGLHESDLYGLSYSTSASLTLMGGYYLIQPLSEAMSLRAGMGMTPYLNIASLALLAVCNPLYGAMAAVLQARTRRARQVREDVVAREEP